MMAPGYVVIDVKRFRTNPIDKIRYNKCHRCQTLPLPADRMTTDSPAKAPLEMPVVVTTVGYPVGTGGEAVG